MRCRASQDPNVGDVTFYDLTERYPDEASAVRYFEQRRWPNGVACVACKSSDVVRWTLSNKRVRMWRCRKCDERFSVTSGTVMHATKLPLRKWLFAFHIIGSSKKGMSALQLARMLHITHKTAWHLSHRIRAAMIGDTQKFTGIVESDEAYFGGKRKGRGRGYRGNKIAVQTIVKRNSANGRHDSQAQTMVLNNGHKVDGRSVGAKLRTHTDPEKTVLMTDESPIYTKVGESFEEHHTVNHKAEEYAYRHPDGHLATTNSAEGLFGNLRRQINGTHHHTSQHHLPKYLGEFDFKYNNRESTDVERTEKAIGQIEGRRLPLFKATNGKGNSLYNRKVGEPRPDYVPKDSAKPEPESPKAPKASRGTGTDTETPEE
jgi:transposase-like protein